MESSHSLASPFANHRALNRGHASQVVAFQEGTTFEHSTKIKRDKSVKFARVSKHMPGNCKPWTKSMREESIEILRKHNNLDLENYKQFYNEFHKYSNDLFESSNIF